jgi:RNA polymerase sigma-70 factor (ECF subfamily)
VVLPVLAWRASISTARLERTAATRCFDLVGRGEGAMVTPVRSDAELLAAVADGDRGALAELHGRHAPWVRSRLRRRCADPDVAAEALQDTFVVVWRTSHRWKGTGDPAAWIWGIAIRRLIGVLRTRDRWTRVPARGDADEVTVAAEESVLAGIEHGELAAAMAALSPELRAVLQATVLDGLTTREAARLLGIPAGTVKTRAMRARAELRGALA